MEELGSKLAMRGAAYWVAVSILWVMSPMKMNPVERNKTLICRGLSVQNLQTDRCNNNSNNPKSITSSCNNYLSQVVSVKREIKRQSHPLGGKKEKVSIDLVWIWQACWCSGRTAACRCVLDSMPWILTCPLCRLFRSTHKLSVSRSVGPKLFHV